MIALGITSLVVGLRTDVSAADWSQSLGFLTNIWAGFTGFLIGVPVALVVLSTVTRQSEDKAATDRVENLTLLSWNQFRDSVLELCSDDRISALETGAARIQELHDETIGPIRNYYDNQERTEENAQQVLEFVKHQIPLWDKAFYDLEASFGIRYSLLLLWFAILREWNTVDQYVRLQRLERQLLWFDKGLDSYLLTRMLPEEFPMADFFTIHEGTPPRTDDSRQKTMWASYKSLPEIADQTTENLSMHLVVRTNNYFPNRPLVGYMAAVERTVSSMRALAHTVRAVDNSGWPTRTDALRQQAR